MTNQSHLALTQSQLPVTYQRHNIIQPKKKNLSWKQKQHFKMPLFLIAIFFNKYLLAAFYVNTKALL